MGIFKKQQQPSVNPLPTRLDAKWFAAWLDDVFARTGAAKTEQATLDYVDKLWMVSDRYCGQAVEQHGPRGATGVYRDAASDATPWDVISVAYGFANGAQWGDQLVDTCEYQLKRFADIIVDPSAAQ